MRIAGVDVGKVSKVEALGGDSPGREGHDEARGRGASDPQGRRGQGAASGSSSRATSSWTSSRARRARTRSRTGDTIPASQTAAPVQFDQVLGTLQTNTRKDLQDLLVGFGDSLNGQPQPGEDDDQDPDVKGETGGRGAERLARLRARRAARRGDREPGARSARERHDLSKLIAGQQKVFGALASREVQLKDLITNFNTTVGALATEEGTSARPIHELPGGARGRAAGARQPERRVPVHARVGARDDPGSRGDARHDRRRLPVGGARRAR